MQFDSVAWLPVLGILLGPSILMIGIMLALSGLAPEMAERAKANIPNVFLGIVLVSVAGALVTAFVSAAGGTPATTSLPVMPLVQAASFLM